MAEKICLRLKSGVENQHFAITSDGWSQPTLSPQLHRLIFFNFMLSNFEICSVTIHWVDEKFIRKDFVLAAFPVDGIRHSGEFLAEKFRIVCSNMGYLLTK